MKTGPTQTGDFHVEQRMKSTEKRTMDKCKQTLTFYFSFALWNVSIIP